jgi:quinol monooxygenase YgiN
MDDMIDYVRDEVMPALMGMSGCVGMSMLCDRESGRAIVTSAWADETSMHATEQTVQDYRRRAAEMMSGEQMAQAWEIAVMHRMHESHDGACARVAWGESDPARAQDNLDTFRMAMMPRMEELPGFCSLSLLVDPQSGRAVGVESFENRETLEHTRGDARALREEFSSAMGAQVTEVAEMGLVLAHLRVPETV